MVLLTLTSEKKDSENFEVYYNSPIALDDSNYEVALIGCNIWFSWYNISHEYSNKYLRYRNGRDWERLVLPDGYYNIELLNYYLKSNANPVDFEINEITSRCVARLKPGHKIDFSDGKLHEILGFEAKVIDQDKAEGKYPINISKGIDRILIHCSLVENSYLNNVKSDVVYSFVPQTPPGSLITLNPNPPIYLPVREKRLIQSIRMQITDQNNRLFELNDEPVTFMLHLRRT